MAEVFEMLDENSGFVSEVPVIIPLIWRYKIITRSELGGERWNNPTDRSEPVLPGTSSSVGDWNTGGVANLKREVCKYQNGSAYYFYHELGLIYRPYLSWDYVSVSTKDAYTFTDTNVEVDWEATFASLRDSYNPDIYAIGALRFTDSNGDNAVDLVKENLVSLEKVNSIFRNDTNEGNENLSVLFNMLFSGSYLKRSEAYGPEGSLIEFQFLDGVNVNGIAEGSTGANWNDTIKSQIFDSTQSNFCINNSRRVNMYLKLWVKTIVGGSGTVSLENPDTTQQQNKNNDDATDDPENRTNYSGVGAGGSSLGSAEQGLNRVLTMYGNSVLPFDSVFLTGENYNNFVDAGGGVITESGVFPNSTALYIDKIHLSVEGSTMTVIEVAKFDATPSLTMHQKIYGYVFDDTHQSKPVFAGYVVSKKRTLNGDTQEITYECRDLSFFFDQYYSPSYYLYRPPAVGSTSTVKTYDRVLKEILNAAGIPDAIVSVPSLNAPPVEWVYEPLSSILEWSTKYFGKYVSYVDRYGRLNIRATDSGSFIKNIPIPAEGTLVGSGDYHVLNAEPITDYSRSRSRIILAGDFELSERLFTGKFASYGPVKIDKALNTGFYWYFKSISAYGGTSRFFYFVLSTTDQLLDKLLSDPGKQAVVQMTYSSNFSGSNGVGGTGSQSWTMDLPIIGFITGVDGGRIIAQLDMSKFMQGQPIPTEFVTSPFSGTGTVTGTTQYTFTVKYAIKSLNPIQVLLNTGLTGGLEVLKRPEFKRVSGSDFTAIDDTALMQQYLNQIKEFYKPVYGGQFEKDGLDLDLELIGKVSITGTSLSATEASNLIIYEIDYDVPKKKTVITLSNKVYEDLPFFDVVRERSRSVNETLVKLGLLEQTSLYNQKS